MKRQFGWLGVVGALAFMAAPAHAQLRIEISKGVDRPVPIAVVPFGWQAPAAVPFDVAGLITQDLASSGRFAPVEERDLVSRPTTLAEVEFGDWRLLDVDLLVVGRLAQTGEDRFTINFQLLDILRGQPLLSFRLDSSGGGLRRAAHQISDMIYEQLTGIRGVFGTRIAYVSVEKEGEATRHRLVVADADGYNARIVFDSPDPIMSPAWSPDGRKLAYVSFEGQRSAVIVQTLRSGAQQTVSSRAGINGAPAFSPDGRKLALTLSRDEGNLDIYVLALANQVLTRLTSSPAIDTEATWSPDGQEIYFTSDRSGGPQIYRVPANGGSGPRRVTFEGSYNARPRLSPSGEELAVVFNDRGNYRIAVVDLTTSVTRILTDGRLDESPSYAPNGATLIYATRNRGEGVLSAVSTDGRIKQRIASLAGEVREPVWAPFRPF